MLSLPFLFGLSSYVKADSLPSFVLGCSYGGGQALYRLVSNGKDIYFASIVNQVNINAAKKSINTVVEPRSIKMVLQEGTGERSQAVLFRDTLTLNMKGNYSDNSYSCDKISDGTIFQTLKSAYETTLQQNMQKQRAYDNRPNKL
jgi:hypothetical protein